MKTIKLSNSQANMVLDAISAYIREEERAQYTASKNGLSPRIYDERIAQLRELKQNIDKQFD